jgi:hypothetical protein
LAHLLLQHQADLLQHPVTAGMAPVVVDLLEVVDIAHHHGPGAAAAVAEHSLGGLHERPAVEQPVSGPAALFMQLGNTSRTVQATTSMVNHSANNSVPASVISQ